MCHILSKSVSYARDTEGSGEKGTQISAVIISKYSMYIYMLNFYYYERMVHTLITFS